MVNFPHQYVSLDGDVTPFDVSWITGWFGLRTTGMTGAMRADVPQAFGCVIAHMNNGVWLHWSVCIRADTMMVSESWTEVTEAYALAWQESLRGSP